MAKNVVLSSSGQAMLRAGHGSHMEMLATLMRRRRAQRRQISMARRLTEVSVVPLDPRQQAQRKSQATCRHGLVERLLPL